MTDRLTVFRLIIFLFLHGFYCVLSISPVNMACDGVAKRIEPISMGTTDSGYGIPFPLVLQNSSANDAYDEGYFFVFSNRSDIAATLNGRFADSTVYFGTNPAIPLLTDASIQYSFIWALYQFDNIINVYYANSTNTVLTYLSYDMITSTVTQNEPILHLHIAVNSVNSTNVKSVHVISPDKYVFLWTSNTQINNIILDSDGVTVYTDAFIINDGDPSTIVISSVDLCSLIDIYLTVWYTVSGDIMGRIYDVNGTAITNNSILHSGFSGSIKPWCSTISDVWIICADLYCSKWPLDLSAPIIDLRLINVDSRFSDAHSLFGYTPINYHNHVIVCMLGTDFVLTQNDESILCHLIDKDLNMIPGAAAVMDIIISAADAKVTAVHNGNEFIVSYHFDSQSYVSRCSYSTVSPTKVPTNHPSFTPTLHPSLYPTQIPSVIPTKMPLTEIPSTVQPTNVPTSNPSYVPSVIPTHTPSIIPSVSPSSDPTNNPSSVPTLSPIDAPLKIEASTTMLTSIIVCGFVAFIIIVICIIYIFKSKLLLRVKDIGDATMMALFKQLELMEKVSFVMEVFDIITDYLFAVELITMDNTVNVELFGWISLISAIFGLILFNIKFLLMKKLIGFQIPKLKNDIKILTKSNTDINSHQIISKMQQIRTRRSDIDIFNLLTACVEDLPQTIVVVLVVTSDVGWGYYSVFNFLLSVIGFCLKCIQVILTKSGCKDETDIIPAHQNTTVTGNDRAENVEMGKQNK